MADRIALMVNALTRRIKAAARCFLARIRSMQPQWRYNEPSVQSIRPLVRPAKKYGGADMKKAHIKTDLPGPRRASCWRATPWWSRPVSTRLSLRDVPRQGCRGLGCRRQPLSRFRRGYRCLQHGHSHPAVVQAIKDAAERFLHISSDYWHEGQVRLAERMNELSPIKEPVMSFFAQSGTESVEAALKLARYVTGRGRFLGFLGGFHGRTMGSLSFTSSKYTQQKGFFPTMPGVTHVPYPNNYRPLFAGSDQGQAVLKYIEEVLFVHNVPAGEVAAMLIEPIQGEGGYLVPPDGFLAGLRHLCDRHGILLIFDEVQSGIGRTGKMFAAEHWGVEPDIMTLAKGLGSGHAHRHGGREAQHHAEVDAGCARQHLWRQSPVLRGCARDPRSGGAGYCANAAKVGDYFMERLRALADDIRSSARCAARA